MSDLTTDEKFGLILQSLGKLEESINEIRSDVADIRKIQESHNEIMRRQHDIVELLSTRSIAQESSINKLNHEVRNLLAVSLQQEAEIGSIKKRDIS